MATEPSIRGRDGLRPVRVLEHDPALGAGLGRAQRVRAVAELVAQAADLQRGPWRPGTGGAEQFHGHLGLLVLEGLLIRRVHLGSAPVCELLGRGDLLQPWGHQGDVASVPFDATWVVCQPTTLAVLDARVARVACRWPEVVSALVARTTARARWLALQMAIVRLRRVDARLTVLFWHLADRWGRVRPEGVFLPLVLTHATLAQLVGAQRPSVTLALRRLADEGSVRRQGRSGWLLPMAPPDVREILDRGREEAGSLA